MSVASFRPSKTCSSKAGSSVSAAIKSARSVKSGKSVSLSEFDNMSSVSQRAPASGVESAFSVTDSLVEQVSV